MIDFETNTLKLEAECNAFIYGPDCPEAIRTAWGSIPGPDRISRGARMLYAHYDMLDDAGKIAMGKLFRYAQNMGWAAFNTENQTDRVLELVTDDLAGVSTPAAKEWPAPVASLRDDKVDWTNPEPNEGAPDEDPAVSTPTAQGTGAAAENTNGAEPPAQSASDASE